LAEILSHEEIAARSSIGYYAFSPPGENERLLHAAGFQLISATDTTEGGSRNCQDAGEKPAS